MLTKTIMYVYFKVLKNFHNQELTLQNFASSVRPLSVSPHPQINVVGQHVR